MDETFLTEARRQPEAARLALTWDDGFRAELGYDDLRGYCPCASCQGHGVGKVEFRRPRRPVQAERIEPVGNYAIGILWSDGHSTGIFRYDYLRRLSAHLAAAGDDRPPFDP